jgi:peptide/nickel transport system permease protein
VRNSFIDNISNLLLFYRGFTFGIIILVVLLFLGFGLSNFAPSNDLLWGMGNAPFSIPPTFNYPFGTTTNGQNLFWLLMIAIKNSMLLGFLTGAISIAIATIMGFLAGRFSSGILGDLLNMIIDSFCVIPGLPVLLVLAFALKDYINVVMISLILSIFGWAWPSKQMRNIVMNLNQKQFIMTSKFSGLNTWKTFLHDYLPYVLPWLLIQFLGLVDWAIGMEVTIAIFGMSNMSVPTIGTSIYWAYTNQTLLLGQWWWMTFTLILTILLMLSIYMVSMSISDYLNPRTRLTRLQKSKVLEET